MVRHLRAREHMETVETHKGEELYVAQYILVKSRLVEYDVISIPLRSSLFS